MTSNRRPTDKQRAFTIEYPKDRNATQSAIRAGYSPRTAKAQGSRLLTKVDIRNAIAQQQANYAREAKVDAVWVLEGFKELYGRSIVARPVLDRKGEPVPGQWQYDGQVAARSLENIGKHVRFYPVELNAEALTQNVNLLITPTDWVKLRSVVIRALQPFPDARDAVVEALREAEDHVKDG